MQPWYFLNCNHETGYQDIYGNNVQRFDFNSVKEYRDNRRLMIDANQEVLGQENLELLYLADLYPGSINFDASKLRIASIDIETVSKNGFPYPNEAKEEIDAISHIDSITGDIWLFSTRKWDRNKSTLSKEILKRAKYKYFNSEQEMLLDYLTYWKSNYPHIVTGWNIDNYDIQYMVQMMNSQKKLIHLLVLLFQIILLYIKNSESPLDHHINQILLLNQNSVKINLNTMVLYGNLRKKTLNVIVIITFKILC